MTFRLLAGVDRALGNALGAVESVTDALRGEQWQIESLDSVVVIRLEGQYKPEQGWEDSATPSTATSVTVGSSEPAISFVSGGARSVRIRSSYRSLDFADSLLEKEKMLRALRKRHPGLRRTPRVRLTWGHLQIEGLCTRCSIRVPSFWLTGLPVALLFEIEITQGKALEIDTVRTGGLASGETLYRYLQDGETFEHLGLKHLGRADRGELIRRENPIQALSETAGERVKVLEADHPRMRVEVRPTGVPFLDRARDQETWQPLVQELGESRGVGRQRGTAWALLPEVVAGLVS